MSKTSSNHKKPWLRNLIIIIVALAIIGGISAFVLAHRSKPIVASTARAAQQLVSVASVDSLSPNNVPLSVIGTVASQNDATILSRIAGQITSLNNQIGDHVEAGQVIASIDNSSQQASVQQSEGAYNVAQAAVSADQVTLNNDNTALENTTQQQQTAVQSAQTTLLNSSIAAIPGASNDNVTATITGTYTGTTEGSYNISVYETGNGLMFQTQGLEEANGDVKTDPEPLGTMGLYIQFSGTNPYPNDTWTVNIPNTSASTYVSNNNAYQNALKTSQADISTASSTVASAQATLEQAEANVQEQLGALNVSKASLAQTIVESPISGNIIDLPVSQGDYVSANSEIAEVSNPNALKVVAYVTQDDASTLSVGNTATINQNITGVITKITQSIDPKTGAIELEVGLPDNTGLTDGASVQIDLTRNASNPTPAQDISTSTPNIIPIVALKITPTGPVVFSVVKMALVAHPVAIGSILGDNIVVLSGLTPDMQIVTDARGLTNGEKVNIKK